MVGSRRRPVQRAAQAKKPDRPMTPMSADIPPARGGLSLPALVLARVCTSAVFMTYPACLSTLLVAWEMSAAQAGLSGLRPGRWTAQLPSNSARKAAAPAAAPREDNGAPGEAAA